MGFAPPVDAPAPGPSTIGVSFGMPPGLPAASLCGFQFPPKAFFKFGFSLPGISFPPPIPIPYLSIGLSCSQSNPFNISAGVGGALPYGGGRTPNADPDPDMVEQAEAA